MITVSGLMQAERCASACLAAAAFVLAAASARADVQVQGDPAAVHMEASQAPRSEILAALGSAFGLRYRTAVPLDGTFTGTHAGSLGYVLSRVLDGYNYVVKSDGSAIEVIVVGARGSRAVPVAAAPPPVVAPRHTATDWRGERKAPHR